MGLRDIFNKPEPVKMTAQLKQALSMVASAKVYDYIDSIVNKYNPNEFMNRKGFKTIDLMLRDEQVAGLLEFKKRFILSTGFHFSVSDDTSSTKVQEIKDFLDDNFFTKYKGLFSNDLLQILSAFEYGFSVSEKIYNKIGDKYYMTRLKTVPPHSIEFQTDDYGNLTEIVQRQMKNPNVSLPLDKILLFVPNQRFDIPYGVSELERCYKAWFAKDKVIKYWNIYLQRFASPFPVGKVPDHFTAEKTAEMIKILDSIQQTASLVMPESASVELQKAENSSGEYDKAIERYNQMIGRAMLLPDLLGFGQTTGGGSYNLGEKQYEMFMSVINQVRELMEDKIQEDTIIPLVNMNFGEQEEYPEFKFLPYDDKKLIENTKIFLEAVKVGMPVVLEDLNFLRKTLNFAEITEEQLATAIKFNPQQQQGATQPQGDTAPLNSVEEIEEEETPNINPEDIPEGMVEMIKFTDARQPSRQPNQYEARLDFQQLDKQRTDIENETIDSMAKYLKLAREAIKEVISRKEIISKSKFSELEKLQLKYKGDLRRILYVGLMDIYYQRRNAVMKLVGSLKPKKFAQALRGGSIRITADQAKAQAEKIMEAKAFRAVGKLNDDLLNKTKQKLQQAIESGLSERDVATQIDIIFNNVVEGAAKAGLTSQPALLNTIARTSGTYASNLATKQVAMNPSLKGFVDMYQYSAIMDDRTSDICAELDGFMAKIDDPVWDSITPPNHFNCRSDLIIITEEDVSEDDLTPSDPLDANMINDLVDQSGDFIDGTGAMQSAGEGD